MMDNLQGGEIALTHIYEVGPRAGRLGYATLYQGTQDPFQKPIWLNIYDVAADAGADAVVLERLRESVHAISHLRVPGLLRALDFGDLDEGLPFVVSERLGDAPTLQQLLDEEGTLAPEECVAMTRRLAEILDALHAEGRAHGQLHPEWIFLPEGDPTRAVLGCPELGFTLSEIRAMPHAMQDRDALAPLPLDMFRDKRQLPPPGESPFWVSDDVYALGAVVYACCVGIHPFFPIDEDPSDSIMAIIKGSGPQPLHEQGVDDALSDLVDRALAATPEERWVSAGAFADALHTWLHGEEEPAPRERQPTPTPPPAQAPPPRAVKTKRPPRPTPPPEKPKADALVEVDDVDRLPLGELPEELRQPDPPSRGDTIAAIALLLLFTTNIAWCTRTAAPGQTQLSESKPASPASGLPKGVELSTVPSGAAIQSGTADQAKRLGETPMILDPSVVGDTPLTISHKGHQPVRMEIKKDKKHNGLTILLEPQR